MIFFSKIYIYFIIFLNEIPYFYELGLFLSSCIFLLVFFSMIPKLMDRNKILTLFSIIFFIFFVSSYFIKQYLIKDFSLIKENPYSKFAFLQGSLVAFFLLFFLLNKTKAKLFFILDCIAIALLPCLFYAECFSFLANYLLEKETLFSIKEKLSISDMGYGKKIPLQIYSIINILLLSIFITKKIKILKNYQGFLFLFISFFILISYFIVDFFKEDLNKYFNNTYSFNQIFILTTMTLVYPFLILSIYSFLNSNKNHRQTLMPLLSSKTNIKKEILFFYKLLSVFSILIVIIFIPKKNLGSHYSYKTKTLFLKNEKSKIFINIPSNKLYYKNKIYSISSGKEKSQTPIGIGLVVSKRNTIQFIYQEDPKKGKIVKYARDLEGKIFKVPYEKMKGLGLKINGFTDYVIHSTTEDWNIGKNISSGCIRLNIPQMLNLFKQVDLKTIVIINYILSEVIGNSLVIYKDVYKLKNCIIEGKSIDTKKYILADVFEKKGQEVDINKLNKVLNNFLEDKKVIPLHQILK